MWVDIKCDYLPRQRFIWIVIGDGEGEGDGEGDKHGDEHGDDDGDESEEEVEVEVEVEVEKREKIAEANVLSILVDYVKNKNNWVKNNKIIN